MFFTWVIWLPKTFDPEAMKKDKYISYIEGRHGKIPTDDHAHGHAEAHHAH
jgi:hypothetical protein